MELIVKTLLFVALCAIVLGCFFLYRNYEVCKFRCKINDLCYEWTCANGGMNAWEWFYKTMPSYDKMLYSFKSLNSLYNWHQKELVDKLLNVSNANSDSPSKAL